MESGRSQLFPSREHIFFRKKMPQNTQNTSKLSGLTSRLAKVARMYFGVSLNSSCAAVSCWVTFLMWILVLLLFPMGNLSEAQFLCL